MMPPYMYMITYAFGRVKKSEMRKAEKENDKRKETEWQKKKKMGRPTDNPKGRPIHVRLDAEADTILEAYCARENVTRAEAIRRGISLLNQQN